MWYRGCLWLCVLGMMHAWGMAQDVGTPAGSTAVPVELTEAEKALTELLTGCDLVGSFSVDGKEGAKQDRYSIAKAVKMKGDTWAVHARIKYNEIDITVPVAVQMHWADQTPVLSVTDLKIPGLGSEFGARILFHGERYAGTWQHGKVGGHMWGRIERTPDSK